MTDTASKGAYAQLMKEALLELKQLRATIGDLKRAQTEPVAIIGMSCRFPGGATSPETFWQLLRNGVDAIGEVPRDRWDSAAFYHPDPDAPGTMTTSYGGFLERIDEFDPSFFGISPREAQSLDPQQRLLLEVTWEALELSGQSPVQLYGSPTGVFIGMSTFDYALHQVGGALGEEDRNRLDGYVATGATLSPGAGRLSYVLGLTGPSMVIDTACSSSLVATHVAVTSLRNRECDLAIVGGVNVILRPEWNVNFSKAHMLAPDGRCKTFDASADGYTRGEGCGVVILQRLADAVAARRNIIAVIRSSAVNQDGASGGLTVPSGPSQEQVIRRALDAAGIRPEEVSYIEAHGTGTSLGDPIEVAALGAVFGPGRSRDTPLRIGSVKTNIGHLEAAAGVAGLMKVALSLRHQEIPPHLHFKSGNPFIDWAALPISVPVERTPWTTDGTPRRAGVSSFGFAGTNAHVVLEEAPSETATLSSPTGATPPLADRPVHILTLSARTPAALEQLASGYERSLSDRSDLSLAEVAFTANTGRAHFRHRLAIVSDSLAGAHDRLAAYVARKASAGVFSGDAVERPKVAFLFTGQGSQYAGMGRQLYETHRLFRASIDRCDELLRQRLGLRLLDVLYPQSGDRSALGETVYTQPALFALEYALASVWQSWGIQPDAVMGHSLGEYVAACLSGVVSLEDSLALVAERARLMQAVAEPGQMVAVQTSEERAAAAIAPYASAVSLAAVNGPNRVVISGAARSVSEVVSALTADGIVSHPLQVSHAFHSPLMESMLRDFARMAGTVTFSPPNRDFISTVTGRRAQAELASPEYWVRQVRAPVRFADGMRTLAERGCRVFVEIGPASTLLAMGCLSVQDTAAVWLPSLRAEGDWDQLLQSLAVLYTRGASIDWDSVDGGVPHRPVELPTYPFQRKRYWVDVTHRIEADPDERETNRREDKEPPSGTETHAVADCLYEIEWCWRPRPESDELPPTQGRWIILSDRGRLGVALAERLRKTGSRCTVVTAGDAFAHEGSDLFCVDPGNPADCDWLAAMMTEEPLRGVVHLWSLDAPSTEDLTDDSLDRSVALESAVQVVRMVARTDMRTTPALWCVTRGAVPIDHESASHALSLAQAPLWGLGRVIALEHPEIWGGLVDVCPEQNVDAAADALARELLAPDGEDQIAFRRDTRYVPRIVRRETEATPADASLDPDGAYLVVGGLGALGAHAARWLISRGARTVILASRRGGMTAAGPLVRELEQLGASRVVATQVDICSAKDVDRLLGEIAATMPPLRGVVHAAGIDAPVPLVDMTANDLRSMLSAKVHGSWLLHQRTDRLNLDLFVCFSSVSSIWGAPTRAHYAAANAFLDGLAHERRRLGMAALTVNWGPWRGGGMAREEELRNLERLGHRGLEPTAALCALDMLLASRAAQCTVADVDWSRFRPSFEARGARRLLSELAGDRPVPLDDPEAETVTGDWIDRLRSVPPPARAALLEQLLRTEVAMTLGFSDPSEVPVDQSVFDLGLDSLRAVQLTVRLQQHLGFELSARFFGCPQVRALAAQILEEILEPQPSAPVMSGPSGLIRYTPDRETEIFAFSRTAWTYRPDSTIESRWRWMFVASAQRLGLEPRVWLYRDGGAIVAHHGAIPARLGVGTALLDSAWFVDTMVLESHRNQATGAQLMIEANNEFQCGLSLGQTRQMREIALGLGWEQVTALQTYILLVRPYEVLRHKLPPALARVAGMGLEVRRRVRTALSGSQRDRLEVRTVDRFDVRHDRLWDSVRNDYRCAVVRDASYLNWKYVEQPGQDFVRLEFLKDGDVVAAAVLVDSDPGAIFGYRRAFVVELIVSPADAALVRSVLEHIHARCAALKIDALLFHLVNETLERHLRAYGFMRRQPTRYLLVSTHRVSAEIRSQLLSPKSWLITMGDADIDRPWEADGDRVQLRGVSSEPCTT